MKRSILVAAALAAVIFLGIVLALLRPAARRDGPIARLPGPEPSGAVGPGRSSPDEVVPSPAASPGRKETTPSPAPGPAAPTSGVISGVVVSDVSGKPIAGAGVKLGAERGLLQSGGIDWEKETRTGPDGRFELGELAQVAYTVRAEAEGHLPEIAASVFPGDRIELRLPPGESLSGRLVLDDDGPGKPLPGRRVILHSEQLDWRLEADTDSSGSFPITGISRQDLELIVKKRTVDALAPGFLNALVSLPPPGDLLQVVVDGGPVLEGRVLDHSTGKPIPHAKLLSDEGSEGEADDQGRYRLEGASDTVVAYAPGYGPDSHETEEDEPGAVEHHDFRLRSGAVLLGTVKNAQGQPLAGCSIAIDEDSFDFTMVDGSLGPTLRAFFRCVSGPDGSYRIEGLGKGVLDLPGSIELLVVPPGCRSGWTHEVEIAATEGEIQHDIELEIGDPIQGAVKQKSGEPAPRKVVHVEAVGESFTVSAATDASGQFQLPGLVPGDYHLWVEADGQMLAFRELQIPSGPIEILLGDLALVEGLLLLEDTREPAVGFDVRCFSGGGRIPVSRPITTEAGGRFQLQGLPTGDYQLVLGPGKGRNLLSRAAVQHTVTLNLGAKGWKGEVLHPVVPSGQVSLRFVAVARVGEEQSITEPVTGDLRSIRAVQLPRPFTAGGEPLVLSNPENGYQGTWAAAVYQIRFSTTRAGRTLIRDEEIRVDPGTRVEKVVQFIVPSS